MPSCLIFILCIVNAESAKILAFFPTPSISHQVVFRPLIKELLNRGHEIVHITTDGMYKGNAPKNMTEIEIHDVSYAAWHSFLESKIDDWEEGVQIGFLTLAKIFFLQLQTKEVRNIIQHEKFDLVLVEACVRATVALSHVFKVPMIQVSSFGGVFWNYEAIGAPLHPILYPSSIRKRCYNLTLWEKYTELYTFYKFIRYTHEMEQIENEFMREYFGPDIPTISELQKNVHMLFLNYHQLWDDNRPVPPSVIYMGGIHQILENDLPKELKAYLDASEHGVIYISFGTNILPSLIAPQKIQMFVNVFSELPYDVIWKWDLDVLPGKTKNIRLEKWLPQSDLLRHSKIKLFITQGGLQSTDEAINAGVPLLGIPLRADQYYNVEKYIKHGIGQGIEIDTMKEDELKKAINTTIEDISYRNNVLKLRSILFDQPETGLERAVWWTEHVMRHGGAGHLRSPAANITWARYLEVEMWVVAGLTLASIATLISISVRMAGKVVLRRGFAMVKKQV